jgi:hypothetical protein
MSTSCCTGAAGAGSGPCACPYAYVLPEGSRLGIGGVTGVEVDTDTDAEAGVDTGGSPRFQRREESEKRLRGRGSSGVVALECKEAVGRSVGAARREIEPRRLSRPLYAWETLPDEEARGRVSEDLERGGLEMSNTERWFRERELEGVCRWWWWRSLRE